MPFSKRLALFAFAFAIVSVLVIFLSPILISNGLRLLLWWKGREQGVKIEFQKIEAPLFKPVVIHGLRVTSARPCLVRIDLSSPRATLALNFRSVFFRSRGRILHRARIDGLHCEIRRDFHETAECNFDWRFLHRLLADEAALTDVDLRVINGTTDFALRGASWTASEIESGKFTAREMQISAPFFRRRFTDLRGATKWENDRLTLGALSLTRGLDIQTITADFSQLEKKRIGIELNLDAFGGAMRASIASENRDKGILWNVAGSASGISLSQLSSAIGLRDQAGGSVRASKFTFRGEVQNLARATASIWIEMTGFSWRDRLANTVMLGASLYNRQIDVQQLYVKQRNNQLTLSGEYALPTKSSDWINPNFRADISASITDLGEFAKLFGGTTRDFAGELTITGSVNARERNFAGHITAEGEFLRLWSAPVDSLRAMLTLKGAQLSLDSLQARHLQDFFNATGEVNLAREHEYSVRANGAISNLSDYSGLLPEGWRALQPQGRASIGWDGQGRTGAHSGNFQIQAENVRLTSPLDLRPFEVKLEGSYSPQNTFFREFRFSNPQATFNSFVTVAPNYLHLQNLHFDLKGKPKLHGNVFIPVALERWWRSRSSDDFDSKQSFDINLTLDDLDFAELQSALSDRGGMAGKIHGRLEAYQPLETLQAKCDIRVRDVAFTDPPRISADLHGEIASALLKLSLIANTAGSSTAKVEAALPLQLARSAFFDWDKPMSFRMHSPAILLPKLPPLITRAAFRDGILTASVEGSGTLRNPKLTGNISCINGRLTKTPGPISALSGQIDFRGSSASLTVANLDVADARLPFHGTIDFEDTSNIAIKFFPESLLYDLTAAVTDKCINSVNIFALRRNDSEANAFAEIQEIDLHGGLGTNPWTITLTKDVALQPESFSFCNPDGAVLQLAIPAAQKIEFGQRALRILRGRAQPAANLTLPRRP